MFFTDLIFEAYCMRKNVYFRKVKHKSKNFDASTEFKLIFSPFFPSTRNFIVEHLWARASARQNSLLFIRTASARCSVQFNTVYILKNIRVIYQRVINQGEISEKTKVETITDTSS